MRDRSNYNYMPAQGDVVQRPAPRRAATPNISSNRLFRLIFFTALPVIWLLSLLWAPFRWLFFLGCLGGLTLLWLQRGFTQQRRVILTGLYAVLAVITLIGALSSGTGQLPRTNTPTNTVPPINYVNNNNLLTNLNNDAVATSGQNLTGIDPSMPTLNADPSGESGAAGEIVPQGNTSERQPQSAAEQVLDQFMQAWQSNIMANMVPLTAPNWRATVGSAQGGAEQNLYWRFSNKRLESWSFEGEPTGTDNDTSRTVTVVANVTSATGDDRKQYRYSALMLQADGQWYVDPNSLATGMRVDLSTPAPNADGSVVEAAPATPAPTKTPSPKTKLYYNKSGGKYYHLEANCSSVDKKYLPLKGTFTYKQINDKEFKNLLRCPKCNPPAR